MAEELKEEKDSKEMKRNLSGQKEGQVVPIRKPNLLKTAMETKLQELRTLLGQHELNVSQLKTKMQELKGNRWACLGAVETLEILIRQETQREQNEQAAETKGA
jgi:hypothetical protein